MYRSCCGQGMWSLHVSRPTTQPSSGCGPSIASTMSISVISCSGLASANPPPRPLALREDAGADQLLEDLGEEIARQVGAGDQIVEHDRPALAARRPSSARPRIAYSVRSGEDHPWIILSPLHVRTTGDSQFIQIFVGQPVKPMYYNRTNQSCLRRQPMSGDLTESQTENAVRDSVRRALCVVGHDLEVSERARASRVMPARSTTT